jgi:hypothetical protein
MFGMDAVILAGVPEWLPGLIGAAGALLLVMMVLAFAAFVYRSLTGGIEWPTETADDEDEVRRNRGSDDEWRYS